MEASGPADGPDRDREPGRGTAAMTTGPTALTRTVTAPNPGPMTLDGTNSYLIGAGGSVVVVDPGPRHEDHLAALAGAGEVELILITHRHADHTEGAARLHALTGAPVRAVDPRHCYGSGAVLGRERIEAAGTVIEVIATPGHTDDSVSLHLPQDGRPGGAGSVLTGDTILGRGTTVIAHPDGDLASYLRSLDVLEAIGPARVLPAHGPQLDDLTAVVRRYREHRRQRLEQVAAVRQRLGAGVTADAVVDEVYTDSPPELRQAALRSVAAQLEYLEAGGMQGRRPADRTRG